jgi:hypothetical protein
MTRLAKIQHKMESSAVCIGSLSGFANSGIGPVVLNMTKIGTVQLRVSTEKRWSEPLTYMEFVVSAVARDPRSRAIPHLQEHLFHVGQPKRLIPRPAVLVECLELTGGNLVLLEHVRRSKKGAHVSDERLGYAGRQLDRLTGHDPDIGRLLPKASLALVRIWL